MQRYVFLTIANMNLREVSNEGLKHIEAFCV